MILYMFIIFWQIFYLVCLTDRSKANRSFEEFIDSWKNPFIKPSNQISQSLVFSHLFFHTDNTQQTRCPRNRNVHPHFIEV